MKEFLVPQALKSSMGMGKDVLRRFRRNIGSLLRDLGGIHRGFPFVDSGRSEPEHSLTWAFVCRGLGGGEERRKKQQKCIHRFRFFFLLPPHPPKVCTYSGPCEEPCSRSEWPAATKGSPYVSTYLLRKDTKNPKSGLKQKTQKLGPVVRRVLFYFGLGSPY